MSNDTNYPVRESFQGQVKKKTKKNKNRKGEDTQDNQSESTYLEDEDYSEISDKYSDSGTSDFSTYTGSSASETSTRAKLIKRQGLNRFCIHLKLLLQKNFWLFKRNLKMTISLLGTHVFFILLLMFF